ncbi:MAG: sigma-70 family RNA polymerase sigma factor [Bacteroidetes bacterium]|nr:MAG: sigma-70 family RNA polymerase sigma factor [Bacteroidota bacterium]
MHKNREYTNDEILLGIKEGNQAVFVFVKDQTFPFISAFIKQNKGTKSQAEEVFHDAMIVVFKKLQRGPVTFECKFSTWFIGICKVIWRFNHKNSNSILMNPVDMIEDESEIEDLYKESREFQLYRKHFNKLNKKKQQLLMASFSNKPYNELFEEFGYKSADVFKTEIARIRKQLTESITADPEFGKYCNGKNWKV